MRTVVVFIFSLILIGCGGYEPVVKFSKAIFDEPVLVKVKIDPEDPSTGEYLQDEIAKMAINRLNITTTKRVNEAKGYILVNSYTINTTPATKDDKGNIIRYAVNAAIEFAIKDKYGFWSKNIVASEFVSVKAASSVSQSAKDKATKIAIKKALDDFVVAVMQRGQKAENKELKKEEDVVEENTVIEDTQNSTDNSENEGLNIKVVDTVDNQPSMDLIIDNSQDENVATTTATGY